MVAKHTAVAYRLAHLGGLIIGHSIKPTVQSTHQQMEPKQTNSHLVHDYQPPPGVYAARDLVAGVSPLLESVVLRLGQDPPRATPARDILIDGLASSLATTGRESTLPLSYNPSDTSRKEIAVQAQKIGKTLVRHVRESFNLERADPHVKVRSPCEGHLWTTQVAALLLGSRSQSQLMEIYNEWLHRMILIRDALLPFENYDEVPLLIAENNSRGIRVFEEPRKRFLLETLTSKVSHGAIVDLAKVFTAPQLPKGGYGLQYSQGLILPAFLSGSTSNHLLRHHPARLDDSETDLLFDYEHQDYYSAPRAEVSAAEYEVPPGTWPPPFLFSLNPQVTKSSLAFNFSSDNSRRILKLQLEIDAGVCVSVDIGQISRGKRYAYRAGPSTISTKRSSSESVTIKEEHTAATNGVTTAGPDATPPASPTRNGWQGLSNALLHRTTSILSQPHLVTTFKKNTPGSEIPMHIIPSTDPVISLALLGKLYPENVILLSENESPEDAEKVGKGFGARFVILERASTHAVNGYRNGS